MKTISKILLYIFLGVIVVGGGILTGRHLSNPTPPLSAEAEQAKAQKAEEKKQRAFEKSLKKSDYIAAPPHFGPLIRTQNINVIFNEDMAKDMAEGITSKDSAKDIEAGQDVILFDTEDYILPLGAKIHAVEGANENEVKVLIKLPDGTNTEFLSKNLSIITLETKTSKRIPLTALQTDDNGEYYIWRAATDDKGKVNKINRQVINKGLSGDEYFEETTNKIDTYDLIITNPDSKIKSDKKYNIVAIELKAPIQNPIRQAWEDFELNRLNEQQARLNKIADDCRNGTYSPAATPSTGNASLPDGSTTNTNSACGGAVGADPLAIFNALTQGAAGTNSGACGSCGK